MPRFLSPLLLAAALNGVGGFGAALAGAESEPLPLPPPSDPVVLSGDESVERAGEAITHDQHAAGIRLLEDRLKRDPEDTAALHALLAARVAQLEAQIRAILERAVETRDLAHAPALDYAEIKARTAQLIERRLVIPEYFQARDRLGEAIEACDAILADHTGHPAVLALKLDLLKILERRARNHRVGLEKEKHVRDIEVINEAIEKSIMPREKQKVARNVVVFDEDIADVEKERVRRRLKERVSLENMTNIEVRKVIETLFAIAGINYVIVDSAISAETLSINVIDESLENILTIISRQVDLRYNYIAGTVYISSSTSNVLETEIVRLQSGLTDVLAQPTMQAGGDGGQGGQAAGQDPFGLLGQQAGQDGGEGKSDLERFLDKIPDIVVGWPAEGTIYLDKKSNSVFIRSTPGTIAEVKRLLQAIDYNSVQVLIEARFVLVGESAGFELGLDWAGRTNRTVNGRFVGIEGGTNTGGGSVNNPLGNPPSSASLPNGMLISGVLGDLGGEFLGATLRALERDSKVSSLAEPKILTLNNAIGQLSLENDVSYVESYQTESQSTAGTPTNNGNVVTTSSVVLRPQLAIEKEEISLRIVPSVARNGDVITLRVLPRVRQLREINQVPFQYQPSPGSDLITVQVERPEFDDRRLETVLHVQNGQTVALGGLVSARDQKGTTGLPWISRVPILGHLFRTDTKSTDRRNLVIFVTAYIIEPSGAKVSDEVNLLRDSARVALPAAVREEIIQRSREEADRKEAETGAQPAWQRGRR